ncbi:VOC family protein [Kaistia geumhonensis]|uniref:Glyoxalase superfamily protein PhnB n=1 Tax=Kaistia geumhonensis TaxID=410839 RepID=A0ABU0M1S0_9HYPH|nr:VOC family protein [Kaistia geumhonensis]MCX5479875.1 VOC family protein [Kaistia geumhonensis]MDQ0514899.1 putative glyoxalase superfamily protein PhnB [Kaistia geumhonensis]
MTDRSHLYPALRYRDPRAAIDFLVNAFGFSVHAIHEGPSGGIAHAELRLGDGLIMVGTLDPAFAAEGRTVTGGTSGIYVSVAYVDAHHDRAAAAGAVVTRPLADTDYGSREYSCRDSEGYEWSFGTYDPLANPIDDIV